MLTPEVIEVLQELLINNFFLIMKRNLDLFLSSSTSKDSYILSVFSYILSVFSYILSVFSYILSVLLIGRKVHGEGKKVRKERPGTYIFSISSSVLSLHSSALNFSISFSIYNFLSLLPTKRFFFYFPFIF